MVGAFVKLGYLDTSAYPLAFIMRELGALAPVAVFFFVAEFVTGDGPAVGGDYYTFVVIGLAGIRLLAAGLQSFNFRLQQAINQGQLEMYLLAPVRWGFLPFGMVQWELVLTGITTSVMLVGSLALGARYNVEGILIAILIAILGLAASFAIGLLDASIKVLAKRADPILALYALAASILSGTFYPVEILPGWLQAMAWLIPHTYVLQALRRALMPGGDTLGGPSAITAILALIAFSVVLYPLALWLFNRSLDYGRKLGLLSGY